jgi:hypothetical protein
LEEGHAARVAGELDLWSGKFAAAAEHHVRAAECFERAAAAMEAVGPHRQMLIAYALVREGGSYHPHFHVHPSPTREHSPGSLSRGLVSLWYAVVGSMSYLGRCLSLSLAMCVCVDDMFL